MAELATLESKGRLEVLADRKKALGPLLRQIGAMMVGRTQSAFTAQGRTRRWRPRHVPNVAGIIADLNAGRGVPSRRFVPRPALVDTGRLRGSIASRTVGTNGVEIGTNVPYASLHQFGGETEVELDDAALPNLVRLLEARPDLAKPLAFAMKGEAKKLRIPARPFLVWADRDIRDVQRITVAYFSGGERAPRDVRLANRNSRFGRQAG